MNNSNWIQSAIKRPGAFSAKAKRAHMSTSGYARLKKNSNNKTLAKEANLAITLSKMRGLKGK